MSHEGLQPWQIERFRQDFERLQAGDQGWIAESDLQRAGELPNLDALEDLSDPLEALDQVVVIKLNGGLGTSMGLDTPKSLLEVRQGKSFLDLTREQIEKLRIQSRARLPLLLMNSFHTQKSSLEALQGFSNSNLPRDFLQSKVPKLRAKDLQPVRYPTNPGLEWCPPGHGEIYSALKGSGLLAQLLSQGICYAFVSNIDNLGATVEPRLAQWFAGSGLDFAMEVTRRTPQDRKGGHLARTHDGHLILRERAQCAQADLAAFEDIERHRYFNTNNLWLNLKSLQEQSLPQLPLIVNRKTVDPTDPESEPVIQLESAMGAAIASFEKTQAVEVSRHRFLPVKTLSDLLLLRSDLYQLNSQSQLEARCSRLPPLHLDSRFYGTYQDFTRRFQVIPSLIHCLSLKVDGNIFFREPLTLEGAVHFSNPSPEPMHLP